MPMHKRPIMCVGKNWAEDFMIKCIYCLENKPESSYKNTEHVIPEAFGRFKNNFTLNKIVCNDCNQYFGDNLELDFARDTFEGQSRVEFNIKKPEDFKSCKESRLIIRIAEGPLKGAYVYREYSPDTNQIALKPVPQVGFKKHGLDEYEYYLLNEIPDKKNLEENNFDLTHVHAIRAFGIEENELEKKLSEKDIIFNLKGEEYLSPNKTGSALCEIEGTIDRKIFRAIAKIGFNYLTYWQGADFVHQEAFDSIRRYVRYGETASYPLVRVLEKPILADEDDERRRLGHLITVNWTADKSSIVAQISLFNWITYTVSVSREYFGEHRNIKKGHFFNTVSKEIVELETR